MSRCRVVNVGELARDARAVATCADLGFAHIKTHGPRARPQGLSLGEKKAYGICERAWSGHEAAKIVEDAYALSPDVVRTASDAVKPIAPAAPAQ
jgi:hypothetical protein